MTQKDKEIPGRRIAEEYWADEEWYCEYYYENNRNLKLYKL